MKKMKSAVPLRDFDFSKVINAVGYDDITEWFSDNDIYLSDIIQEQNISI